MFVAWKCCLLSVLLEWNPTEKHGKNRSSLGHGIALALMEGVLTILKRQHDCF